MFLLALGLCVVAITQQQSPWWLNPDETAMQSLTHNEAEWVTLIMKSIVQPEIGNPDDPWPWLGGHNAVSNFAAEVDRGYILCIRCKMNIPEPLSQKLVLVNGRVCMNVQMHLATPCAVFQFFFPIHRTCKKRNIREYYGNFISCMK